MNFHNACSLGPQTEEEARKITWHKLDCLTANKLKTQNKQQVLSWFNQQDDEWTQARRSRLLKRLRS